MTKTSRTSGEWQPALTSFMKSEIDLAGATTISFGKEMKKQWHCSQVSPVGWYIASFIERTDPVANFEADEPTHQPWSVWENRILVKASTPDEALARTKEHLTFYGGDYKNTDGVLLRGSVVGLTSLIAIHDELEDGAEIEFLDHTGDTVEDMLQRVRADALLEAFTVPDNTNEQEAEQTSSGQPATRSELDSEGIDKPQPESEGRSR